MSEYKRPPHSDVGIAALYSAAIRGVIFIGIGVAAYWIFV